MAFMAFPPCTRSTYFRGKRFRKTKIARIFSVTELRRDVRFFVVKTLCFHHNPVRRFPSRVHLGIRARGRVSAPRPEVGAEQERSCRRFPCRQFSRTVFMISNSAQPALTLQLWVYGNERPGERQQFINNPFIVLQNRANSPHRHQQHRQRSYYLLYLFL